MTNNDKEAGTPRDCEAVKIWTQEVLQSETECIKSMPYVKTEAQFVQVFMNYKAPTVNYRLLFKRNMWKLSQQQWDSLLKQHRQFKNTVFAHQADAAVEHENYPCSFLKSSEHVRHFSQNVILPQKFSKSIMGPRLWPTLKEQSSDMIPIHSSLHAFFWRRWFATLSW